VILETHLIPFLDTALSNRSCVKIYGTDYPTPDGTRSGIRFELASAHTAAPRYLQLGGTSTAIYFNLVPAADIRQVIATAEQVTGRTISTHNCARGVDDPAVLVAQVRYRYSDKFECEEL